MSGNPAPKLKQYEASKGWVERPADPKIPSQAQAATVASMDFADLDFSDVQKFEALLETNKPNLVVMHALAPLHAKYIKDSVEIQRQYYMLECPEPERKGHLNHTTMIVVRHGTPYDISQIREPSESLRFRAQLHLGVTHGPLLPVNILSFEASSPKTRLTLMQSIMKPLTPGVVPETLLITNIADGIVNEVDVVRSLRSQAGFADAFDTPTASWSLWLRSAELKFTNPVSDIRRSQQQPRYIAATIVPNGGVPIPVPRSAGYTPVGKGTPPGHSAAMQDPGVVNPEAAIAMKLKANMRSWKLNKMFEDKSGLIQQECCFDLTKYFRNESELHRELDSGHLPWPADYAFINNKILCSDAVQVVNRQAFRKYARDVKDNAELLQLMQHALDRYHASLRSREWSEHCCTIVYQITPKEMRYNITREVGFTPDSLKRAIQMLNCDMPPDKHNPLKNYQYNYALLYSIERQGFWLIAEKHVPCDIVACRQTQDV